MNRLEGSIRDVKVKREKLIKVYLAEQIVEALEGSKKVFEFECVTGDEGHETHLGNFHIIRKPEDYHYISKKYNVPMNYPLFFTSDGKAFHQYHGPVPFSVMRFSKKNISDMVGSHGCVRLTENAAKTLYNWAPLGTKVEIKKAKQDVKSEKESKK